MHLHSELGVQTACLAAIHHLGTGKPHFKAIVRSASWARDTCEACSDRLTVTFSGWLSLLITQCLVAHLALNSGSAGGYEAQIDCANTALLFRVRTDVLSRVAAIFSSLRKILSLRSGRMTTESARAPGQTICTASGSW